VRGGEEEDGESEDSGDDSSSPMSSCRSAKTRQEKKARAKKCHENPQQRQDKSAAQASVIANTSDRSDQLGPNGKKDCDAVSAEKCQEAATSAGQNKPEVSAATAITPEKSEPAKETTTSAEKVM
jgi:hypothetical protein